MIQRNTIFVSTYRRRIRIYVLVLILTVTLTVLFAHNIHAVEAGRSTAIHGLSISPVRTENTVDPGTVHKGQLTIGNSTSNDMVVRMTATGFGVINQQYDYSFDPGSKLVDWVRFDPVTFNIAAGKSQIVTYTLNVPVGAEPRGQYISLFATNNLTDKGLGISTQERVASLLYITVGGDVTRSGNLLALHSPWVSTGGESQWTASVQNTGTTHFRSRYSLSMRTLWGSEVSHSENDALILPGSIRLIQNSIPQPVLPGVYTLVYDIGLGDTPNVSLIRYIIYVPIYVTIVLISSMCFILVLIVWRKILRPRLH